MSTCTTLGRHRAVPVRTSPLTVISKAVSNNAGSVGRQAAVIVAASGLVLTAGLPAQASPAEREVATSELSAVPAASVDVSVPATAKVSFERAAVTSAPAPVVVEPVEEPEPAVVETEAAAAVDVQVNAPQPAAAVEATAQTEVAAKAEAAPAAEAPAAASSDVAAGIVASAYSQIGTMQDCTAMVEKALRSVGIAVGDIAPEHFYRFGSVVSTPQPGDLMIRPGHVGIYVGNGQAISGGFNGGQTLLHSASDLAGSSYVRVGK